MLPLVLLLAAAPPFTGSVHELPPKVAAEMRGVSWRPGCPVPLEDLRLLRLNHRGYDGAVHEGELVVHEAVADEVLAAFRDLYEAGFPVEKMRRIERYKGSDDASMADNNTSAFNCRPVAGKKSGFSKHSYGLAIDVNPETNPFVTKRGVAPASGAAFADRSRDAPGMIKRGGAAWRAFTRRGWRWGGAWRTVKDYQHFEKRPAEAVKGR